MSSGYQRDPSTPRWTPGDGAGGTWKQVPQDFVVEELPADCPRGRGVRWYSLKRTGRDTIDVARTLARAADVPLSAVAWAGLKDREAVVTQRFTVVGGRRIQGLPGAEIVAAGETRYPLRAGDLLGNRFVLRIRGGRAEVATERLARIVHMPNRFGPQRVGHGAPEAGRALLLGGAGRDPGLRTRFALSAWQAACFNRVLDARGPGALDGDLRVDGVPTGPLFGAKMRWPRGAARALEEGVLRAEDLPEEALERVAHVIAGDRRALWVTPREATIEHADDGFVVRVLLPPGCYATALLQELL